MSKPTANKKVKKLFVINSNLYIRHYLQTNALEQIDDGELYFVAHRNMVTMEEELAKLKNFVGYFNYDQAVYKQNHFMSSVLRQYYRKRSKTFVWKLSLTANKLKRHWAPEKVTKRRTYQRAEKLLSLFLSKKTAENLSLKFATWMIRNKVLLDPKKNRNGAWWVLANPLIFPFYKSWFEKNTPTNQELKGLIQELKPDLVIFPSNANDPVGFDLIRMEKELNYKTLFLIDNWDNLSSKSVFPTSPDYLVVWGEQSREHARDIHHIPTDRVFPIGTPRFEHYFEAMEKELPSPYPFKYILYVGCQVPFDEPSSLRYIDEVLTELHNSGQLKEPLKLVYRPHPWRAPRQCPDKIDNSDFNHVIIDEQVREHYKMYVHSEHKGIFQPALDYYPKLLKNAEFVVGPLTSMLLEAALFKQRVVPFAYDDGIHLTSPKFALESYMHFEGLPNVPGMFFAHTTEQLKNITQDLLLNPEKPIDWNAQQESLKYYLYRDETPYNVHLKRVVETISQREGWVVPSIEPSTSQEKATAAAVS